MITTSQKRHTQTRDNNLTKETHTRVHVCMTCVHDMEHFLGDTAVEDFSYILQHNI